MPANWNTYVQKLITPDLKQISRGQLKIDGSNVSLRGEVANEAQRQRIASAVANQPQSDLHRQQRPARVGCRPEHPR